MNTTFALRHVMCWLTLLVAAVGLALRDAKESRESNLIITSRDAHFANVDTSHTVYGSLVMVEGDRIPYTFNITSKGNGALEIANLLVRVYDEHDDCDLYQPRLLATTRITNAEGRCMGLEFSGLQIHDCEEEDEPITTRPIHAVCMYDASTKRFIVTSDPAKIVISDNWVSE